MSSNLRLVLAVLAVITVTRTETKQIMYTSFLEDLEDLSEFPTCKVTEDPLTVECKFQEINDDILIHKLTNFDSRKHDWRHSFNIKCERCSLPNATLDQSTLRFDTELSSIYLQNTPIRTLNLTTYPGLILIKLDQNGLTYFDAKLYPEGLSGLTFTNNYLPLLHARHFEGLVSLVELDLGYNKIRKIHGDAFVGLNELTVLDLGHNEIRILPPQLLSTIPQLQRIVLGHNYIYSVDPNFFYNGPNLVSIDISYNPLFGIDYKTIFLYQSIARSLREFNINGLPCTTLIHKFLEFLLADFVVDELEGYNQFEYKRIYEVYKRVSFALRTEPDGKNWYENGRGGVKCFDYYGQRWSRTQGLDQIGPNFKISDKIEELMEQIKLAKRKSVFGCELMALKEFLVGLNSTVLEMEGKVKKLQFNGTLISEL